MVGDPMAQKAEQKGGGLTLRDEQKRFTRDRLIAGALVAFERKGYAAATIDDIVAEANASRATFYLHFKRKADVVLVLAKARSRDWRDLYRDLASGGALTRERLYPWLDAMVANYEDHRASVQATNQAIAVEPDVAEVNLENWQGSIAVMAESIERWYGAEPEEARVRAALLLSQLDRFFQLWIVSGLSFDREQAIGELTDQWLTVLRRRTKAPAKRKAH
jgi:AcrR family transcriptional regulator